MITAAVIIELITGVLKFPSEVLALVRVLKGTSDEQRQAVVAQVQKMSDDFKNTGRPTWDA